MARHGRKSSSAAHPFVRRMIEDPEFRSTMHDAVSTAKSVFTQLNSSKAPSKKLADDAKLQDQVREALEGLHQATTALATEKQEKMRRHRRRGGRRMLALIGLSTVISVIACPWTRGKALDKLFGAEEEFQYSPPPVPPSPPAGVEPAPAASEGQASPV